MAMAAGIAGRICRYFGDSQSKRVLGMLLGLFFAAPAIARITSPFVTMPPGPLGVTSSFDRPAPCSRSCAAGPILLLRGTSGALLEALSSSPPAGPGTASSIACRGCRVMLEAEQHHIVFLRKATVCIRATAAALFG